MKAAVVGSGAWGTALALLLLENGNDVTLWSYTEEESAVVEVLLQGITQETLRFQLGQTTAHHIVSVGEATGEYHELSLGHMLRGSCGDGLYLSGEAGGTQCALGLNVAVGAGIFEK